MFGYVTICKEHLSHEGQRAFQSYYCGLCRETGKRCSQLSRMGLSYDITFLAIVLSSLFEDGDTKNRRCAVKGFKEIPVTENDRAVSYAADMGVILAYLKQLDDWRDDRSIKALFIMALFYRAVRKARKRNPEAYAEIRACLDRLSLLEKRQCAAIDETADCFAKILEILFTPRFIENETDKRALGWLGYNIGRWIYIIDAYHDIEKDIKKKNYNTLLAERTGMTAEEVRNETRGMLKESLTFTLENAASAYNLLGIKRNKEVIENILFTALALKQGSILGETNESL